MSSNLVFNLLHSCGTVPAILEEIPIYNLNKEQEKEMWIMWGRSRTAMRLLVMASVIVNNAVQGKETSWVSLKKICGGSHNTTNHLIKDHFSKLCLENSWPSYDALIVGIEGSTPEGFYKNNAIKFISKGLVDHVGPYSDKEKDIIMDVIVGECFNTNPPNFLEFVSAILRHVEKYGLMPRPLPASCIKSQKKDLKVN